MRSLAEETRIGTDRCADALAGDIDTEFDLFVCIQGALATETEMFG
jgi:hypothetical protein